MQQNTLKRKTHRLNSLSVQCWYWLLAAFSRPTSVVVRCRVTSLYVVVVHCRHASRPALFLHRRLASSFWSSSASSSCIVTRRHHTASSRVVVCCRHDALRRRRLTSSSSSSDKAKFFLSFFCILRLASRSHRQTDRDQRGLKTRVSAQWSATGLGCNYRRRKKINVLCQDWGVESIEGRNVDRGFFSPSD